MNQTFLSNGIFVYLFFLMLWSWIEPFFPKLSTKRPFFGPHLGIAMANILLGILLVLRWVDAGHFPLSNLYESLIFLAWGFTTIHLICLFTFQETTFLNAVTTPISLLTYTFASFSLPQVMQKATALVPALQSNWLMMHVTVMILSYAALICGSLLAFVFLLLPQRLTFENPPNKSLDKNLFNEVKSKELESQKTGEAQMNQKDPLVQKDPFVLTVKAEQGRVTVGSVGSIDSLVSESRRLTSLGESLDNLSYRILGLGFPLLTLGILSGAVWANEAWGSYWSWDPKETWALITWLVFAIYLHTRLTKDWRGTKSAILATLGFVTVWICYLGVNLLGTGLHSYGWFTT